MLEVETRMEDLDVTRDGNPRKDSASASSSFHFYFCSPAFPPTPDWTPSKIRFS
jgi:hypothetical protein